MLLAGQQKVHPYVTYLKFLLIARYVRNVAKRSRPIWDQCNIEDRPTSIPERAFLEEVQTAISP